ncbi:MAG TPA: glycosyltransferase [Bryobacteraceae bacterium]|jgi:glycosyltransferase involved in cell wall biosynthesis|nr:glycosyltransferase [Bryobacteraceae bacterium]
MRLSLILATRGRTKELYRLFDSLAAQTHQDFELIVVDQNEDDRVCPVVEAYREKLEIHHEKSDSRGHAAANNVGLRLASGDIIVIPDDDCWYPKDIFARLVRMFEEHPEWDGVTGYEASSEASPINVRRFDAEAGQVTLANVWRRHISFTMFFRRSKLSGLFYDETLGVGAGTRWGSGEETDYLLQFIRAGNYVHYDPALVVFHPDWGNGPYNSASLKKAHSYGMGMGRVLRMHPFPAGLIFKYLIRPLGGTVIAMITGRLAKARYHWSIFTGRLTGWLASAGVRDTARQT